jgi:UDP-N-acetylmuramate dehydrogenase
MIVLDNEPMMKHTTFRTGGPAKRFIKIESVEDILKISNDSEYSDDFLIIGNGSNLLVSDKGIDTTVIQIYDEFNSISLIDDVTIHADSGALLSKVAVFARDNSLTGFEFASGIPGTAGGAVFMNAGAYGGEMKDCVVKVYAVVDGKEEVFTNEEMKFGYRESAAMQKNMIITGVDIRLQKGDKESITAMMNDLNGRRREKQPLEYPSAGSTFKRPTGYFAGKLIMDSGLAGYSVGDAEVSEKHCGFVINKGHATSDEIYKLICDVQKIVKDKTGIMLETEVRLIGEF